jgi:hypothetical protein
MTYKINPELPLKYHLETHTSMPSYPTRHDFMFDVINYLVKVFEAKSKVLDSKNVKFTSKTLKYVYGDKFTAEFVEKLKPLISSLVEEGSLTKNEDTIFVSEPEFQKYYTPITN